RDLEEAAELLASRGDEALDALIDAMRRCAVPGAAPLVLAAGVAGASPPDEACAALAASLRGIFQGLDPKVWDGIKNSPEALRGLEAVNKLGEKMAGNVAGPVTALLNAGDKLFKTGYGPVELLTDLDKIFASNPRVVGIEGWVNRAAAQATTLKDPNLGSALEARAGGSLATAGETIMDFGRKVDDPDKIDILTNRAAYQVKHSESVLLGHGRTEADKIREMRTELKKGIIAAAKRGVPFKLVMPKSAPLRQAVLDELNDLGIELVRVDF
ncbi:MAG: hypothetical protein HYV63_28300, partial [Candidatus Schekmanbacteria bacterium]|nr:hypothetical protein [Candidatus Schekmanbacteria bacterium]